MGKPPRLTPALTALRTDFNLAFPRRQKASDGWIGDAAHAGRDSDHNPDSRGLVHAIDVDRDLVDGTMSRVVEQLVDDHRAGRDRRLTYVIWQRRIASATHGWRWRAYYGSNPHTEHAHFSGSADPALERDTRAWRLKETTVSQPTPPTPDAIADAVWTADVDITDGALSARGAVKQTSDRAGYLANVWAPAVSTKIAMLETALLGLAASNAHLQQLLEQLTADPATTGSAHPIVAALEWELDRRAGAGSGD